jgi:hypothetical protein
MICKQAQDTLDEIARGALYETEAEQKALEHSAGCRTCSEHLERARELTRALSSLAAEDRRLEVPLSIESALRAGFRAERRRLRVVPQGPVLFGLAAAAVVVFAALLRTPPPASSPLTRPERASVGFLPLPDADPWDEAEGGEVIRMSLDRDYLQSMGWPVSDEPQGIVVADVLVGEDGLARAVRFVE